jgi:hypothetical protein
MRSFAKILGFVALSLTFVPPVLFATGALTEPMMKWLMVLGAILWFATAPLWMRGGAQ